MLYSLPDIDFNPKANNEWTPLFHAASRGLIGIVNDLMELYHDFPNYTNELSPLHIASQFKSLEVVKALCNSGYFDINTQTRSMF